MVVLDGERCDLEAAMDAAIKYAKGRDQFGQKISKFQGIRWAIADIATEIEAAKQLMFSAAAMKDRGEKYTMQASMAKLFASEMVNQITGKALQVHGGYGFTADYPVERYYRDARVFTLWLRWQELDREIDSLLFETRVRREVVSDTVTVLLQRAAAQRQSSLNVPQVSPVDPRPLSHGRVQ